MLLSDAMAVIAQTPLQDVQTSQSGIFGMKITVLASAGVRSAICQSVHGSARTSEQLACVMNLGKPRRSIVDSQYERSSLEIA